MTDVAARYQTVKRHILERIASRDWPPGTRIPSENALVEELGISRMTVNRAVRELAREGHVIRLAGVGTFVADRGVEAPPVPIIPISRWIAARGNLHSWQVIERSRFAARPELARLYGLVPGTPLDLVLILHAENGTPIQVEERYVNSEAIPGFAAADLEAALPDDILAKDRPGGVIHSVVEAVMPTRRVAELLALKPQDPCLLITQRLETNGSVASIARLFHAAGRFRLESAS